MSDLGCWAMPEHNGYVIRIHGSEHWATQAELEELGNMLFDVAGGHISEVLGSEYKELQADSEAQAKQPRGGLLAKLGLKRVAPIKRRTL